MEVLALALMVLVSVLGIAMLSGMVVLIWRDILKGDGR